MDIHLCGSRKAKTSMVTMGAKAGGEVRSWQYKAGRKSDKISKRPGPRFRADRPGLRQFGVEEPGSVQRDGPVHAQHISA